VKLRTGWILAGAIALALATGASAYAQQTDGESSASRKTDVPAATAQKADAQSSASRSEDAQTSASTKLDATSSASKKSAGFEIFNLYDFVKGPLFIAAWVIFAAGFAWRIRVLRRVTRSVRVGPLPPRTVPVSREASRADEEFLLKGRSGLGRFFYRAGRWIRRTVFSTSPVMGVISLAFHVGLFLVPLLLPAHSVLLRQSIGVGLPTLPEPLLDRLTLVLLVLGAFFLLRRILFPRVRALTTVRDYLVLLLVAAPFLTAYAAYHQWLTYRTMVVLHMLAGELLISAIPFTKLGHMPFLIFSRFFLSAERSWRPAVRRW
jgi:nitrate reductase gamma subunit